MALTQGLTASKACRKIGVSEQTYYSWRRGYGGIKVTATGERLTSAWAE